MKLRKAVAFLIIGLFITSSMLMAQLPGMKVYTQLDGFPGTIGYHICQDENGFIWIGTDNGVACFDGKKFRVINGNDGLEDKEILLAQPYGKEHVLFLPLLNNIAYCKKGQVVTSRDNKSLTLIANKSSNNGIIDPVTQKVWICDRLNNSLLHYIEGDSLKKVRIWLTGKFDLIEAYNNNLYLTVKNSNTTLGCYNVLTHNFIPIELAKEGKVSKFNPAQATYLSISGGGRYLVAIYRNKLLEVYKIINNKLYCQYSISVKNPIRFVSIDRNNHLWLAFQSTGIEYWGDLDNLNSGHKPLYFLDGIIINHVMVDRDGHVWFTTEQNGLYFISSRHWNNAKLTLQMQLPLFPSKSVAGDNEGNIYIGHSGKSCFTMIHNGKSKIYYLPEGSPSGIRYILPGKKQLLIVSEVLQSVILRGDTLLFGNNWKHGAIKDVFYYNNDYLVLAENSSVSLVKAYLKADVYQEKDYNTLFTGRATAIIGLPDGGIIIGTPNGMYRKHSLTGEAVKLKHNLLNGTYITDIEYGMDNNLLIGTNTQGLYNYNYITDKVSPIIISNNKTLLLTKSIYRQNDSTYWISTDNGVYKITFAQGMSVKNTVNYTFFDGLPSSDVSATYVKNDTAYIATASGMGILLLNSRPPEPRTPVLWITCARIEDSLIRFPSEIIHLNYKQSNIQLSLSAISYENIGNMKYLYRLIGLSDKWTKTESPEISFSGLLPGEYILEVYATDFKGLKSSMPLYLPITVHPAFWQTTWFIILTIVAGCALVLFISYKLVVSELHKKYRKIQQKKRLAELELEAIKAQINPHFVYNCLNSIQYFSYTNDLVSVKHYLDIFARLIRQTMQYSQETFIKLEEEINYLDNYLKLEKVRYKEKLEYHLHVDETLNQSVLVPSMLVQPYIENAMKHGVAKLEYIGEVWISFTRAINGGIKVTIEDNGPGLQNQTADTGRKPLGMRITSTRANSYNQLFGLDIHIDIKQRLAEDGTPVRGTSIELFIPPIIYGDTAL